MEKFNRLFQSFRGYLQKVNYNHVFIIFLIAMALQSYDKFIDAGTHGDKMVQLVSAKNLIEGNGVSIKMADPNDLSQSYYKKYTETPLGYAWTIAPLYWMFGDYVLADAVLNLLGIVFLFTGTRYIFNFSRVKPVYQFLFYLFWCVSITPFKLLFTTDVLSLGILYLGIGLLLKFHSIEKVDRIFQIGLGVFIGIVFFLPSFYRFAYYPYGLGLLFCMFLISIILKKKRLYALISLIIVSAMTYIQLMYQSNLSPKALGGAESVITKSASELSWKALMFYDAIFYNSFFLDIPLFKVMGLNHEGRNAPIWLRICLFTVSSFLLFILIRLLFNYIRRLNLKQGIQKIIEAPKNQLIVILIIIVGLNALILSFMAVNGGYIEGKNRFIVTNPRYSVTTFVAVQLLFVVLIQYSAKLFQKRFLILYLASVFFSLSIWGYLRIQNHPFDYHMNFRTSSLSGRFNSYSMLEEKVKKNEVPVVFAHYEKRVERGEDPMRFFAALGGAKMISVHELDEETFSSSPIDIWIPIFPSKFYKPFESKFINDGYEKNIQYEKTGYYILTKRIGGM